MTAIYLVLLILSAVCFAAAASERVATRYNLVALGLLFWVLVPLIQMAHRL